MRCRCISVVLAGTIAGIGGGLSLGAATAAYGCPAASEQARIQEIQARSALAPALPDCRAYEQVSPVDGKNGVDALGSAGLVEASPNGGGVVFFALTPFSSMGGAGQTPTYLSTRESSGGGWSTQGIESPIPPANVEHVYGVTEDLGKSILLVGSGQSIPPCEPTVMVCGLLDEGNAYIGDTFSGTFELLGALGTHKIELADATPNGSRVLFETDAKLTPTAPVNTVNLYEWDEAKPPLERVTLADVLPDGTAPKMGASAGPGGPAVPKGRPFFTQGTISESGTRIFFTSNATGRIYMREPESGMTVQISGVSERPLREEEEAGQSVETEPAFWRGTTRDGSFVYYTEGGDLFRFNVAKYLGSAEPEEAALGEAREQLTTGAEGVMGLLGFSEEGDPYAYFAAPGVLASNENVNKERAVKGSANMYEWHDGTITFIAAPEDDQDWRGWTNSQLETESKPSRVSTNGQYLLFRSSRQLTRYSNNGNAEFYLFDGAKPPSVEDPLCVSCNPKGVSATSPAFLSKRNNALIAEPVGRNDFIPRNLAADGRRVFFETEEALVPGDANMRSDVYEWEADGEGSCEAEAQNGGCLYLISTGQGSEGAYFGDASYNGDDVFFFTRQQGLVGQDQDNNVDLYDARVDGGIASQYPAPPAPPCEEEAGCRGATSNESPSFGIPATVTLQGAGNLIQPPPSPPSPQPHHETRAEKLAKALKNCRREAKSKRMSCERKVRKLYGTVRHKATKGGRR